MQQRLDVAPPAACALPCRVNVTSKGLCNRTVESCPVCVRFQPSSSSSAFCAVANATGMCTAPSSILCPRIILPGSANNNNSSSNNPNASHATITAPTSLPTTPEATIGATSASSSAVIPARPLFIVLAVGGCVFLVLALAACIYRRRKARRDRDVNLSIVRADPTKLYHPALAKTDNIDMWVQDYGLHRSTSQTQSTAFSDLSMPYSTPYGHGQGIHLLQDPWLYTNPYRQSSIVELMELPDAPLSPLVSSSATDVVRHVEPF
ncbi:Aste57867_8628 [Aphanomyces stellatus]|uniref:Aste57867_8628 protein n=1 Tax=Aphanomyces stellatus TaxID=120398 RepID=A0A485KKU9_9STRA|nr:hypothetical protein As57867_008594 [Aphanomyces stellatus]VFT85514.1 Aste57867_8628 [Aphanomyces stellatus]